MPQRELLTINQSAERASVSRRTIYHWLALDRIAYVRTQGGAVRIYADSLFQEPPKGEFVKSAWKETESVPRAFARFEASLAHYLKVARANEKDTAETEAYAVPRA